MKKPWKPGDLVRFAHQGLGPRYTVIAIHDDGRDCMVELKELPGHFAAHLFLAHDYSSDSIVPRGREGC